MAEQTTPPGVNFVWDQAERRLEAQTRQADALDTKAAALVGFHAVVVGFLVSVSGRLSGVNRWLVAAAVATLLLSGLFALLAFRIEWYDRRPSPETLWRFGHWDESSIRYRMLSTRFDALQRNRERLQLKSRGLAASVAIIGVIALVGGIVGIVELLT